MDSQIFIRYYALAKLLMHFFFSLFSMIIRLISHRQHGSKTINVPINQKINNWINYCIFYRNILWRDSNHFVEILSSLAFLGLGMRFFVRMQALMNVWPSLDYVYKVGSELSYYPSWILYLYCQQRDHWSYHNYWYFCFICGSQLCHLRGFLRPWLQILLYSHLDSSAAKPICRPASPSIVLLTSFLSQIFYEGLKHFSWRS